VKTKSLSSRVRTATIGLIAALILLLINPSLLGLASKVAAQCPDPPCQKPAVTPTPKKGPPRKKGGPSVRPSAGARPVESSGILIVTLPMPPAAKLLEAQGTPLKDGEQARIRVTVDENGKAVAWQPLQGHPALVDAAWSYAKQDHFNPHILKGRPVKFIQRIECTFTYMRFSGLHVVLNPTGDEGVISGAITYAGLAQTTLIDTSADPACGQMNPNLETEETVVKNGKLANVFVYISMGTMADGKDFNDLKFDVPTNEVILDQSGCRFSPHVLGIQVNQKLKITNSDPTEHNIHFMPRNNPQWNQIQPNGAPPIEHRFAQYEVLIPVKSNQQPWMKAYIGVLTHPFYAVTNSDGSFEIRGVPPGTYTLTAWHEGGANGTELAMEVTINPKSSSSVRFRSGGATLTNVAAFPRNDFLRLSFLLPAGFGK